MARYWWAQASESLDPVSQNETDTDIIVTGNCNSIFAANLPGSLPARDDTLAADYIPYGDTATYYCVSVNYTRKPTGGYRILATYRAPKGLTRV
jgi:hypothetical protein